MWDSGAQGGKIGEKEAAPGGAGSGSSVDGNQAWRRGCDAPGPFENAIPQPQFLTSVPSKIAGSSVPSPSKSKVVS
jgi:hypothetical protein